MPFRMTTAIAILAVALFPACEDQGSENDVLAGAIAGAAIGYVTAEIIEADDDWQLLAILAGAAAGTLVARNHRTNRCAYARGNGRYYTRPCPRY